MKHAQENNPPGIETKTQLLKILEKVPKNKRNTVTCSLIGHSKIQDFCWGQYSCGRCDALVGDNLAGVYPDAENIVLIGHNCDKCKENYKKLGWKDKIFVKNPFTKE